MYNKPNFEIIELSEEDVVATSLVDKGDISIDDIPTFVWPDDTENP